jgi:biopolymer transport protein ExbD
VLKPGSGAAVLGNWEHVDTLFKINNFKNRKIDTLDEKEQEFFKTTSIIPYLKKSQEEPLTLFLPKEESEQLHDSSGKGLVVLILNENEVYMYNGAQVKDGRRCTYKELELYLATKKSRSDFFVVIKPGEKSTYRSTVDMLDLMTVEKIKNYKMEDVTEEEEAFINKMIK